MIGLGKILYGDSTKIGGYDPSKGMQYEADGKTLNTGFMTDQEWSDFASKGGIINDANKLELDGVEVGSQGFLLHRNGLLLLQSYSTRGTLNRK